LIVDVELSRRGKYMKRKEWYISNFSRYQTNIVRCSKTMSTMAGNVQVPAVMVFRKESFQKI